MFLAYAQREGAGLAVTGKNIERALHRVVAEYGKIWIKKKIESVDFHAENAREDVVAELMHRDEYHQCENQLCGFNEYIHRLNKVSD